jgi:hypothetical protein
VSRAEPQAALKLKQGFGRQEKVSGQEKVEKVRWKRCQEVEKVSGTFS